MSTIKIIRSLWGYRKHTYNEIPPIPTYPNEIVYVWGRENEDMLKKRGFETRYVEEETSPFAHEVLELIYERKLIALDLALKEFGEVLMLDWDCYILRPLDKKFLEYLQEKPIQIPLYIQHEDCYNALYESIPKDHPVFNNPTEHNQIENHLRIITKGFLKWNWKWENGLVSPNFGFVYSRDITLGEKLIKLAVDNNIEGCVEEHATFLYSDCTLKEYINQYQPVCTYGVSNRALKNGSKVSKLQKRFNDYMDTQLKMDIYCEHI